MVEQLLGSKTRYHLMQLFLYHPETSYYVRQITRILQTQINSVRRELLHLETLAFIQSSGHLPEEAGLTSSKLQAQHQSTRHHQKKYYRLNTNFFLYPELRSLFLKEQLMSEKDLVKSLRKVGTINYLVLTGMFVGLENEIPTDILIVGKFDSEKLAKTIAEYEESLNKEMKYVLFSYPEYKYRLNIRDRFLHTVLQNKKIVLLDDIGESNGDPKAQQRTGAPPETRLGMVSNLFQ